MNLAAWTLLTFIYTSQQHLMQRQKCKCWYFLLHLTEFSEHTFSYSQCFLFSVFQTVAPGVDKSKLDSLLAERLTFWNIGFTALEQWNYGSMVSLFRGTKIVRISAGSDGGPRFRSAHAWPFAQPPSTPAEVFLRGFPQEYNLQRTWKFGKSRPLHWQDMFEITISHLCQHPFFYSLQWAQLSFGMLIGQRY